MYSLQNMSINQESELKLEIDLESESKLQLQSHSYSHLQSSDWICLDDGTGKKVYYYNTVDHSRSRTKPPDYIAEKFSNGYDKYYFRGMCIRCRKKEFPSVLSMKNRSILFSLNLCTACILRTTPGIKTLDDTGDIVWESHIDTPMNLYVDLNEQVKDKNRISNLLLRSIDARYHIQKDLKLQRDLLRWGTTKMIARQYGILSGKYLSWGLGKIYDEYYGEVNKNNIPHGRGMKIYSDGSTYAGEWRDGFRHTNGSGVWSRPEGYDYDGSWVSDMKHGYGVLKYPDGSKYIGEFARDLEHGAGILQYADGSQFEGRFRFGKRDGPGTMTNVDNSIQKDIFRDYVVIYTEKPLIKILKFDEEVGISTNMGMNMSKSRNVDTETFQPDSLFDIANQCLSYNIRIGKLRFTTSWIRERLPNHLKPIFAAYFLWSRHPTPTIDFVNTIQDTAFKTFEEVAIHNIKLKLSDIESIIFFQSANINLHHLRLTSAKLDANSIGLICHQITRNGWPNLQSLDLSYNSLDVSSVRSIVQAASDLKSIRSIKLSGCGVFANGAFTIANILQSDTHIEHVDIAFNSIKGQGAEALAEILTVNKTITSLNLRHNDIGVVGGHAFAEVMRYNTTLKVLCLADNKAGQENIVLISARIKGNIRDIIESTKATEIVMPSRYECVAHQEIE